MQTRPPPSSNHFFFFFFSFVTFRSVSGLKRKFPRLPSSDTNISLCSREREFHNWSSFIARITRTRHDRSVCLYHEAKDFRECRRRKEGHGYQRISRCYRQCKTACIFKRREKLSLVGIVVLLDTFGYSEFFACTEILFLRADLNFRKPSLRVRGPRY